jgi:hypothetical protein
MRGSSGREGTHIKTSSAAAAGDELASGILGQKNPDCVQNFTCTHSQQEKQQHQQRRQNVCVKTVNSRTHATTNRGKTVSIIKILDESDAGIKFTREI